MFFHYSSQIDERQQFFIIIFVFEIRISAVYSFLFCSSGCFGLNEWREACVLCLYLWHGAEFDSVRPAAVALCVREYVCFGCAAQSTSSMNAQQQQRDGYGMKQTEMFVRKRFLIELQIHSLTQTEGVRPVKNLC